MNNIRLFIGISILSLSLLQACTKSESFARVDGIVRSHVDIYQSGTGGSTDLVRGNQMNSGFEYGDVEKVDWKSGMAAKTKIVSAKEAKGSEWD